MDRQIEREKMIMIETKGQTDREGENDG